MAGAAFSASARAGRRAPPRDARCPDCLFGARTARWPSRPWRRLWRASQFGGSMCGARPARLRTEPRATRPGVAARAEPPRSAGVACLPLLWRAPEGRAPLRSLPVPAARAACAVHGCPHRRRRLWRGLARGHPRATGAPASTSYSELPQGLRGPGRRGGEAGRRGGEAEGPARKPTMPRKLASAVLKSPRVGREPAEWTGFGRRGRHGGGVKEGAKARDARRPPPPQRLCL